LDHFERLPCLYEGRFKLFELDSIHEKQDLTLKAFALVDLIVWQAIVFTQ
jgi:hypothetical protein